VFGAKLHPAATGGPIPLPNDTHFRARLAQTADRSHFHRLSATQSFIQGSYDFGEI
jgi:hypothetical protein